MIKRIRELIAEADFSEYDDLEDTYSVHISEIKKFAELIVKECAELMYGRDENGNCKDGDLIKEHFGLEK